VDRREGFWKESLLIQGTGVSYRLSKGTKGPGNDERALTGMYLLKEGIGVGREYAIREKAVKLRPLHSRGCATGKPALRGDRRNGYMLEKTWFEGRKRKAGKKRRLHIEKDFRSKKATKL